MKSHLLIKGIIIPFLFFYLTPLIAQTESKVAVITVSGSGKTQDEAKQNALRNAIEQAFGAFISSNTQILNDELVKDEIVSVSSGNIQEYTVLSEVQTPDGYWSNTVKAKVAIDKLTSFCESKGISAEFKGSLFALNIKQQELNKSNEEKAIEDMCVVLKNISENCFNYEINVNEPVAEEKYIDGRGRINGWNIPITIYAIPNNNLKLISDYFIKTLRGLSLIETEKDNYENLGVKTYSFIVESTVDTPVTIPTTPEKKTKKQKNADKTNQVASSNNVYNNISEVITLRSEESLKNIEGFLQYLRKSLLNFEVITNLESKMGSDFFINYNTPNEYDNLKNTGLRIKDDGFKPVIIYDRRTISLFNEMPFIFKINEPIEEGSFYVDNDLDIKEHTTSYDNRYMKTISLANLPIEQKVIQLTYFDFRTTDEISKISDYQIIFCKNKLTAERIFNYGYRGTEYKVVKE